MGSTVGRIFNIQRFSLDDGDGIRTLVFLKGCPLHCKWCHNAESWSFSKEIIYNGRSCMSCRMCQSVCESADNGAVTELGASGVEKYFVDAAQQIIDNL